MLHNLNEIIGNVLEAEDGQIGRCKDFLFDDTLWTIRYMVADTAKWLPGRKVLMAPAWINSIDWAGNRVNIDFTTEAVKNSPEYDPLAPVNREYEVRLYDFYGRPKYWD